MTEHESALDVRPLALTLGVAGVCWVVAITQMRGMDMGVATTLGSWRFFLGIWAVMMTAMMLPGAAPAVLRYARTHRRMSATVAFLTTYLAVWILVGIAVYGVDRPHGTVAAGVITVMLTLLAVGAMSLPWMSAITALVLVQKLCPPRRAIDVSIAAAIVTFGTVILLVPSSIPGLVPSM